MAFEDREADLADRLTQLPGEASPIVLVAAKAAPDVAGANAVILVERLGVPALGQVVLLLLLHLVVAGVGLVRDQGAQGLLVRHGFLTTMAKSIIPGARSVSARGPRHGRNHLREDPAGRDPLPQGL